MEVFFILIMLVVLAGAILYDQHKRSEMERAWKSLARARELDWTPGGFLSHPSLRGQQDGYPVEVSIKMRSQGKSSVPYTRVHVMTQRPVPEGLSVSREDFTDAIGKMFGGQDIQIGDRMLDPKLRFRSSAPETTKAVFADPQLRSALMVLLAHTSWSKQEETNTVLEVKGRATHGLAPLVDNALKLARAIDDARIRPWQAAASRHSLTLTDSTHAVKLTGPHRGQSVVVQVDLRSDRTFIDVPLQGLPPGLSVSASKQGDGIRLGDPVLDGMVTVRGHDPDRIRSLLRSDELRGVLLAVVHAWPGSSVSSQGVRLRMPGSGAVGLDARLEEATTLARLLTERSATPSASQGVRQRPKQTT